MFVTYLKDNGFLCHDKNEIHINENRQLFCKVCNRLILDVNKHLTIDTLPIFSSFLAKHYANWTGDVHVPCRIVIKDIPGIEPRYVEISYFNLINTIELLGTLNQDFIQCKNHHFDVKVTLKSKILENFIDYYMNMINTIEYDKEDIEKILKAILRQMKESFNTNDYNIFEYYLNIICPYVKTFDSTVREEIVNVDCPGEFFVHLSQNATIIRKHFGKYCLPFDVIYIMIYCFACHKDLDIVANFVFDLIARLCNKYFDEPTKYQEKCKTLVNTHIHFSKKSELYHITKALQEGKAAEIFSIDFYDKFAKLQQLIFAEFCKVVSTPSDVITKFAFSQSFPFILFPNSANYYSFMCMMGYATSKLNLKHVAHFEKGASSSARQIMHFVEDYVHKVENFGKGTFMKISQIKEVLSSPEECPLKKDLMEYIQKNKVIIEDLDNNEIICLHPAVEFWTLDVFKLFLSNYEDFTKHLLNFLNLLGNV